MKKQKLKILHVFTVDGHFFSPNNKKWFKLFHDDPETEHHIIIQDCKEDVKNRFHKLYKDYYTIQYFKPIKNIMNLSLLKRLHYLKIISKKISGIFPDIIHVHGLYSIYMIIPLLLVKNPVKIIFHIWGSDFNIHYKKKIKNRLVFNYLIRKSNLVWVNWLSMADDVKASFPRLRHKIKTIPLGVTRELFQIAPEEAKNKIMEKYSLSGKEYLIIYTRNFAWNSNYHKLVEAFRHVKEKNYKVVFQYFRRNEEYENLLKKQIKKYKLEDKIIISHFQLTDYEIKALYELAGLTFSMTNHEQFSRTVWEAILSNTNIILNNIEPYRYLKYFFNWNVDLININDTLKLGQSIDAYIKNRPTPSYEDEKQILNKMFTFDNKRGIVKDIYKNLK